MTFPAPSAGEDAAEFTNTATVTPYTPDGDEGQPSSDDETVTIPTPVGDSP